MTLEEMINQAIINALTNPKPSYTIGEISVDYNSYITSLMNARRSLNQSPDIAEYITIGAQL